MSTTIKKKVFLETGNVGLTKLKPEDDLDELDFAVLCVPVDQESADALFEDVIEEEEAGRDGTTSSEQGGRKSADGSRKQGGVEVDQTAGTKTGENGEPGLSAGGGSRSSSSTANQDDESTKAKPSGAASSSSANQRQPLLSGVAVRHTFNTLIRTSGFRWLPRIGCDCDDCL